MAERYHIHLAPPPPTSDPAPPFYVALTSGVELPDTATFDVYENSSLGHPRTYIAHAQRPLEFVGTSVHSTIAAGTQYYVGLVHRKTKKATLFPAALLHVERVLKRDRSDLEEDAESGEGEAGEAAAAAAADATAPAGSAMSKLREQKVALGSAFGTKRAKKILDSYSRNKIQADALEETATVLTNSVRAAPGAPSAGAEDAPDLPLLPPHDTRTRVVSNIFPLAQLIPAALHTELAAVTEPLRSGTADDAARRFQALFHEPPLCPADALVRAAPTAVLFHFLAKLLQINRRQSLTPSAVASFLGCSDRIASLLTSCLFAPGTKGAASHRLRLSPHLKLRLTFHAIVASLHMLDFRVSTKFLGEALKVSPTAAGKFARQCGCVLESTSRESKLQSTLEAVLKAPFVVSEPNYPGLKQRK